MITRGTITSTIYHVRLTPDERGTIQRATELTKQTMSDMVRTATLEYAARVLRTAR